MVAFAHDPNQWQVSPLLKAQFEEMIPRIRQYAGESLGAIEPNQREAVLNLVVIHAFAIYVMLAKFGLGDVAYPRALAWLALRQVQNSLA